MCLCQQSVVVLKHGQPSACIRNVHRVTSLEFTAVDRREPQRYELPAKFYGASLPGPSLQVAVASWQFQDGTDKQPTPLDKPLRSWPCSFSPASVVHRATQDTDAGSARAGGSVWMVGGIDEIKRAQFDCSHTRRTRTLSPLSSSVCEFSRFSVLRCRRPIVIGRPEDPP